MRKSHLILLVATAILALSSAYSLAAINQVYNIGFEWYSQLEERYEGTSRDVSADRQSMAEKDIDLKLYIVDSSEELKTATDDLGGMTEIIREDALSDNIYICCSLGRTDSPEFRIKAVDIAQRGNNLEIRLSINTPEASSAVSINKDGHFTPVDIIRIKKTAFPTKGKLLAVFKNQDGIQLEQQYFDVR